MLYKKIGRFLVAIGMILSLGACSEYLNEKKKEPEILEIASDKIICLKDIPSSLQKFVEGSSTESEVRAGTICLQSALVYFKNKTYGAKANQYTSDEMRNFFSKYFLKENQITPEFAHDMMKLKKAILGGSENYVTGDEINEFIALVDIIREESIALIPHMKVLTGVAVVATKNQISAATNQLQVSLGKIFAKTKFKDAEYTIEDFEKILSGFTQFIKGSNEKTAYEHSYKKLKTSLSRIVSVKELLIGSQTNFVRFHQWNSAIHVLSSAYDLYLKNHFIISKLKFQNAVDLQIYEEFVDQGIRLFESSLQLRQYQSSGIIPVEEIDRFVDRFFEEGLGKGKVQTGIIKKLYRIVFMRVFSEGQVFTNTKSIDPRAFLGIERRHLMALRREFKIWQTNQSFINSLIETKTTPTLLPIHRTFDIFDTENLNTVEFDSQLEIKKALVQFQEMLKSKDISSFDNQGRLLVSIPQSYSLSWSSLTKLNFMRTLSSLLLIGYGEKSQDSPDQARLLRQGLIDWYDDFKDLGLSLKAFDPRKENTGAASFSEASLFTRSGDGNEFLNYNEIVEYLSLLFGAGMSSSQQVMDGFKQCQTSERDLFENYYLKEDCVRKTLRSQFNVFFENLPGMSKYVGSLDQNKFDQFFRYLKMASSVPGQKENLFETQNIRTLVTILHYIENLMQVYDRDGNQSLSVDEIYLAAPRFSSLIQAVHPTKNQLLAREGFVYLVLKGRVPTTADLLGFELTRGFPQEATRTDILRLFGVLKDQLNML